MKVHKEHKPFRTDTPTVIEAEYNGDFVIRFTFSDESEQEVDFKPFLKKLAEYEVDESDLEKPSLEKYAQEENFITFEIHNGNINWNNYEMVFPLSDLYHNSINQNQKRF